MQAQLLKAEALRGLGRTEEALKLLNSARQARPDDASLQTALRNTQALQLGEAICAIQRRYFDAVQGLDPASLSDLALPKPLLELVDALRRSLRDANPSIGTVSIAAAIEDAHASLSAAQARVCQAASQGSPSMAKELEAAIAGRDGARANLARQLRSAQSQLRNALTAANVVEVRTSASQMEALFVAARTAIADEAATRSVRVVANAAAAPLEVLLTQFDDWVASMSIEGVQRDRDLARDALLGRLSKIFVDVASSQEVNSLVQQLLGALDDESALAARRDGWIESIPFSPLLAAAQERIELQRAACLALERQQAELTRVERELHAVESVMDPAVKEQIVVKLQEVKAAKRTLDRAIAYDLQEAKVLEKEIAYAEQEGETSVIVGRTGSTTLGIAEARQRARELRAAVRDATRALGVAASELASNANAFPELIVHICSASLWLPPDLVPLWRSGWTLESIADVKLLASPADVARASRSSIYQGKIVLIDGTLREVAIKEYKLKSGAMKACVREATLLHRARHPYVAELLALFMDPATEAFYIVMPLYTLGQLDEWIRECKPDQISLRRVLYQVLLALAHLHSHCIIHMDVKPANILISAEGTARLADCDVSQDLATRTSAVYTATKFGFTLGFDAPELTRTGGSEKTDVFAFGATIKSIAADGSDGVVELLCHAQPEKRPTAAEAMQHPFFASVLQWKKDERRRCCVSAFCEGSPTPLAQGVECSEGKSHFVCGECFEQVVTTAASEDLRMIERREGGVPCPGCAADGKAVLYTDADVAKHVSSEAFVAYNHMRQSLLERRMASEFDQQLKERLAEELKRLVAMDEEQRRVWQACRHIADELLTAKCPRPQCKQAFIDFAGCFDLACSRCPCHFCGWCGADCGTDAHAHVRQCEHKLGADPYFAPFAEFEKAQRGIKSRKVKAFLATLDAKTASAVRKQMGAELRELFID